MTILHERYSAKEIESNYIIRLVRACFHFCRIRRKQFVHSIGARQMKPTHRCWTIIALVSLLDQRDLFFLSFLHGEIRHLKLIYGGRLAEQIHGRWLGWSLRIKGETPQMKCGQCLNQSLSHAESRCHIVAIWQSWRPFDSLLCNLRNMVDQLRSRQLHFESRWWTVQNSKLIVIEAWHSALGSGGELECVSICVRTVLHSTVDSGLWKNWKLLCRHLERTYIDGRTVQKTKWSLTKVYAKCQSGQVVYGDKFYEISEISSPDFVTCR